MAKKKTTRKSTSTREHSGTPKFPYSTQPNALRKFLKEIPNRPKPPKVNRETLSSWDVTKNSNGASGTISVMKKVGFLDDSGAPTQAYEEFMKPGVGPTVLGQKLRQTYQKFFEASHSPHTDSDETLKNLLNIHSGGGPDAMRYQLQTFKALCEHADFDGAPSSNGSVPNVGTSPISNQTAAAANDSTMPPVNIALHIHLPENKSGRDYTAMIEDIGRFIFGREVSNESR